MPPRRFIDSNIFTYILLNDPNYGESALQVLTNAENLAYEATPQHSPSHKS